MRRLSGIVMIVFAAIIGIVEFRAFSEPAVAQDLATRFAEHDPFPRLPWDMHVIFIMAFLLFLGAGLNFIFTRKRHATSRIEPFSGADRHAAYDHRMRYFPLFVLRISSQIVVVVGALVLCYGCYRFYDGPIVARHGAYYGMQGQPRSLADYYAFKRWEAAICVLWPSMFALCALRYWLDPRSLAWVWTWEPYEQNNLTTRSS